MSDIECYSKYINTDNPLIKFAEEIKNNFILELTNNNNNIIKEGWYFKEINYDINDNDIDYYCNFINNIFICNSLELNNNDNNYKNYILENFYIILNELKNCGIEVNNENLNLSDVKIIIGTANEKQLNTYSKIQSVNKKMCKLIIYLENTCIDSGHLNLFKINEKINCCSSIKDLYILSKSIEINPSSYLKKIIILDESINYCQQSLINGIHISVEFNICIEK